MWNILSQHIINNNDALHLEKTFIEWFGVFDMPIPSDLI